MSKKILILTAGKTGGHRSASNAIKKSLEKLDKDLEIVDYDSNKLFLGYKGYGGEQGYITLTTRFRFLRKLFFEFTSFIRPISNYFLYHAIKRNFLRLLRNEKPDVILSLHPCFVGSVLKVLKKYKKIPLYVCVLDPIKFSNLWVDKNVDLYFLPTEETKERFLSKGFNEDKIVLSGFPINFDKSGEQKVYKNKIKLLYVNPTHKGLRIAKKLIECAYPYNVDIDVITGSDENLKEYLIKKLPKREGLNIYGYVNDMQDRLLEADIILTKAGPNIMFEAILAKTPIVLTGHLMGQEEKNYLYITKHGYGLKAETPSRLSKALKKILIDEPNLLNEIKANEGKCKDTKGAEVIAKTIINLLKS